MPRLTVVAGARPNFPKVAPLIRALSKEAEILLVHTGQHYDFAMSEGFFEDLELPTPYAFLKVGSGSHAEQTAGVLVGIEQHLLAVRPDAVIVVGDVNSTLAAALAAAKMGVPVAHVEAGLRSNDWEMPEEINRVLTDRLSTWLFTPSEDADTNLLQEGIESSRIHMVGNVMIDTLYHHLEAARRRGDAASARLGLSANFGVLTLHRPSNVDDAISLRGMLSAIAAASAGLQLVFPVHPRVREVLEVLAIPDSILMTEPLSYLDFIGLVTRCDIAITDSGGLQEETSALGVPCVTVRESTERPVTTTLGTNQLAGVTGDGIKSAVARAMRAGRRGSTIPLWDGRAADRIADILMADLGTPTSEQR